MTTQKKSDRTTEITVRNFLLSRIESFCNKYDDEQVQEVLIQRFMLSLASRKIASMDPQSHEAEAEMMLDIKELLHAIRELSTEKQGILT